MALVRSIGNSSFSGAVLASLLEPVQAALAYAGFNDLTAAVSGSSDKQLDVYTGEGSTNDSLLVRIYNTGGDGYIIGRANGSVATTNLHWGLYIKIVATKHAVAFASSLTSNPLSTVCAVITKDNNGDYVVVVNSLNTGSLASPYVIPRSTDYSALISYDATTSNAFGATALSLIPVPSFDGSAKYLPACAFAHAVQYLIDGSVTLGNQVWYSIGGSWYILDEQES